MCIRKNLAHLVLVRTQTRDTRTEDRKKNNKKCEVEQSRVKCKKKSIPYFVYNWHVDWPVCVSEVKLSELEEENEVEREPAWSMWDKSMCRMSMVNFV
ncbi:hypothetical protein BLOT_003384 [Blomia tropicalis]|nr:hypothetical protein BLOT_003384 [Blomia tropicalis]